MVTMELTSIKKCRAIVKLGPATDNDGMRLGEFYQVTLDPSMVSPGGKYIRLGAHDNDEITGWQLISALTVCEILGEYNEDGSYPDSDLKPEPLEMMVVV